MSVFDTVFGFLDPFSSSDVLEIVGVGILCVAGYIFVNKSLNDII